MKSDIQEALEHQEAEIIKQLIAMRKHIFYKLDTCDSKDRDVLRSCENRILGALSELQNLGGIYD